MKQVWFAILLSGMSQLHAQALFTFDFTGPDPDGDLSVPVVPNLAVSPFTRANVGATSAADVFSSSSWSTAVIHDPAEFVSFTLQPSVGYDLNLSALRWRTSRSTTGPQMGKVELFMNGVSLQAGEDYAIPTSMAVVMCSCRSSTPSPAAVSGTTYSV